ncbi:MAG TPA: alpha/beta hydrolase [Steroidobacteraceae bacterium]|nr:alpha/beta hydrolase [Steroidobacteraceae bacterium]
MKNRYRICAQALLAMTLAAAGARAQDWTQYYTVVHRGDFKIDWGQFYRTAEARTMEVRKELRTELDVPYGKDPKQRMDLYLPLQKARSAPVLLFLHGGGFREGDRRQYGYVAEPFAKQGIITVVASYRLTPQFAHPAQPDDAKAAVAWIHRSIAKYGGNPTAIYISGHSAGAILTADLGVDLSWLDGLKIPRSAVRGIVPISGPYDLAGWKELSEYIPTPQAEASASALRHVNAPAPIAIVAYGSEEARFMETSSQLAKAIEAKGAKASVLVLEGKDHAGTVWELSDPNSPLTRAMLAMIKPAS